MAMYSDQCRSVDYVEYMQMNFDRFVEHLKNERGIYEAMTFGHYSCICMYT